jgi:hypothetical protein
MSERNERRAIFGLPPIDFYYIHECRMGDIFSHSDPLMVVQATSHEEAMKVAKDQSLSPLPRKAFARRVSEQEYADYMNGIIKDAGYAYP